MISDGALTIFIIAIIAILIFIIISLKKGRVRLLHKLYFCLALGLIIWMSALIGMRFTDPANMDALYVWDACTYLGGPFGSALIFLIALTFVKGLDRLPRGYYLFLIPPLITNVLVWTNPLHHKFYVVFDVDSSKIEFGPLMFATGMFSYFYLAAAIIIMINFAVRSNSKLYLRQAVFFALGDAIPFLVNCFATFKILNLSIVATPLAFVTTIIFHGFAIYYFHMLDIKPIAMQQVLNKLSDCYLVTSETGLVVNFNDQFYEVFGRWYGIQENMFLKDCVKGGDTETKTAFYNLLSSIDTCREIDSSITFEQSVLLEQGGQTVKKYYMAEVTPLKIEEKLCGFLAFFKDVTRVKESMQRLQDSQARLMEQERLASLGQMVGGIAHNLKTPIMSVSGSMLALQSLIDECRKSLGDDDVTVEDYREIYGEMEDWTRRVKDACAYMSDIITAVKGQAVNMSMSETEEFSVIDALKRVTLLMRHELVSNGFKLELDNKIHKDVILHGDINSLVQVVNNLVGNAVDAQKPGSGRILITLNEEGGAFRLRVIDHGPGVPADVKDRLFKQMITSKGALGTGLGVYISSSVVKAKFNGTMWHEDNPGGGSIFGISIPQEYVAFQELRKEENSG